MQQFVGKYTISHSDFAINGPRFQCYIKLLKRRGFRTEKISRKNTMKGVQNLKRKSKRNRWWTRKTSSFYSKTRVEKFTWRIYSLKHMFSEFWTKNTLFSTLDHLFIILCSIVKIIIFNSYKYIVCLITFINRSNNNKLIKSILWSLGFLSFSIPAHNTFTRLRRFFELVPCREF